MSKFAELIELAERRAASLEDSEEAYRREAEYVADWRDKTMHDDLIKEANECFAEKVRLEKQIRELRRMEILVGLVPDAGDKREGGRL